MTLLGKVTATWALLLIPILLVGLLEVEYIFKSGKSDTKLRWFSITVWSAGMIVLSLIEIWF